MNIKIIGLFLCINLFVNPFGFANKMGASSTVDLKVAVLNVQFGLKSSGLDIRPKLIPNFLKSYDVILFSEVFDGDARRLLLKNMKRVGFKYATCVASSAYKNSNELIRGKALNQPYIVDFSNKNFNDSKSAYGNGGDDPAIKPLNGGIIIVSKYPIIQSSEWIFAEPTEELSAAKKLKESFHWNKELKGVVYAKIKKDKKKINVFATHTQAQYSTGSNALRSLYAQIGISQMEQIGQFIKSLKIPKTEPVIVGGDLNIDKYSPFINDPQNDFEEKKGMIYKTMIKSINAIVPDLKNNIPPYNDFQRKPIATEPKQIDFVMVSKDNKLPKTFDTNYVAVNTKKPWGEDETGKEHVSLTDHPMVEGFLEFVY